jgi:TctA family transporter
MWPGLAPEGGVALVLPLTHEALLEFGACILGAQHLF